MSDYRRVYQPGGSYFFTLNLSRRLPNDLLVRHIQLLRYAFQTVRLHRPFRIDALVVLPDHLHCVLTLPAGDTDYATRWNLLKGCFSRSLPADESLSCSRIKRRERGIWQRRYWEHRIRDDRDLVAHLDYVHINPLKHQLVRRVADWPWSTFHREVQRGRYSNDWAGELSLPLPYQD